MTSPLEPELTMLALRGARTGIWIWDLNTHRFTMSREFKELLGYDPHELPDGFNSWMDRLHNHDRELVLDALRLCITGHSPVCDTQQRLLHKDGTYRWFLSCGACHQDSSGHTVLIGGTVVDITMLKAAETESARRAGALSKRLHDAQDAERRHVVRELHDDIGEVLTALNHALEDGALACTDAARPAVLKSQELVLDLVARVHELTVGLRPPMLDDLGIVPTITWHVERYRSQTGIVVTFRHSNVDARRYAPDVESAIYRIVQEGLTNVARHARVQSAFVRIWQMASVLNVQVHDDGVGFAAHPSILDTGGGLAGMRERVRLLSGDLVIDSSPGRGTSVTAHFPVEHEIGRVE